MFGILGAPLFWAHAYMGGGYCDFKRKFAAEPLPRNAMGKLLRK